MRVVQVQHDCLGGARADALDRLQQPHALIAGRELVERGVDLLQLLVGRSDQIQFHRQTPTPQVDHLALADRPGVFAQLLDPRPRPLLVAADQG